MEKSKKYIAYHIVNQITNSNMTFTRKMIVLKLLDEAFRKYQGKIYLSDKELNENDMLTRFM